MKFEQRTARPSLDMLLMYCSKDFITQSSIFFTFNYRDIDETED